MNSEEVWVNILIPLLFGQLFLYLKTLYDNYLAHKNEQRKIKFDEELTNELFTKLSEIDYNSRSNTCGPPSISKQELIKEFNQRV